MSSASRIGRAVAGIAVLLVLVMLVNGWWRDYRGDAPPVAPVEETTPTPDGVAEEPEDETDEAPDEAESAGTVVVLIEGLNFRREPSRDGELIRGFGRGTRLEYLDTVEGWYHVRDEQGVEGYVSASPQYTELEE